jgi:RNA polymerase sigma-70 factor (ECF subfamily)
LTDDVSQQVVALLPRMRRFALSLCRSREDADDLVQETVMRALAHIEQWQPGTRLDNWMLRIAKNAWHDRGRKLSVRQEIAAGDDLPDVAGSDGRRIVEGRLSLAAVMQGMQKLPADLSLPVALVCIDGRSYQEAADILEIPVGTVMSRLARARRYLHEVLDGETRGPGLRAVKHGNGARHDH